MLGEAGAFAERVKFSASLNGAAELPPTDSPATGKAFITFDTSSKTLKWVLALRDLSGHPTAAHFHGPATQGEKADPVLDIRSKLKRGIATLTAEQAADLMAGKWYINIHTEKFPSGEIRGQVVR
jgi:CHRD domain